MNRTIEEVVAPATILVGGTICAAVIALFVGVAWNVALLYLLQRAFPASF